LASPSKELRETPAALHGHNAQEEQADLFLFFAPERVAHGKQIIRLLEARIAQQECSKTGT
jgi:hypothetical protein